jgi:hypothetical protein
MTQKKLQLSMSELGQVLDLPLRDRVGFHTLNKICLAYKMDVRIVNNEISVSRMI